MIKIEDNFLYCFYHLCDKQYESFLSNFYKTIRIDISIGQ